MSAAPPREQVHSLEDVQAIVRNAHKVLPTGAGSKPGLTRTASGAEIIDMRGLSGIVEYKPAEYTITALAGTPVSELDTALRENGQFLPFDPVLVAAGSTVGGMVASGLSGSGRLRYGGLRDFILGTRFVDGKGRLIRGGGKVVKNAAGFDFPKLLVGSLGRLGILIDATFKVFPRPASYASVLATYDDLQVAIDDMQRLSVSPVELIAMDLIGQADGGRYTLATRIGGSEELLPARAERLQSMLPSAEVLGGNADIATWKAATEFSWVDEHTVEYPLFVKVPLTLATIPGVESALAENRPVRRYAVAGNVLWLPWSGSADTLHELLSGLGLAGVVLRGGSATPLIGAAVESVFAKRIKAAIDPDDVYQTIYPA